MPKAAPERGTWTRERVDETAALVLNPERLREMLTAQAGADIQALRDLLHKARAQRGLDLAEAAALIQVTDPAAREEILAAARHIHGATFGRRVHLHAPVCPTNRCVDDCLYCPLRRANTRLRRTHDSTRDIQRQIVTLLDEGHRHVMLVFGNDRSGIAYVRDMIWATYGARSGMRQIQRVDLNLDPSPGDDLRQLADAGPLGTYHVYQETYDQDAYAALHPSGPKSDYAWRLTCHHRAIEAGLADVGLGVLLGAGDLRFDVLGVLAHARHLSEAYGHGPVAITYPRMIAAPGAPASGEPHRQVSDDDFRLAVAVTRLALPHTHIVMCTPATRELRLDLYSIGVSAASVGSESYPGVYTADGDPEAAGRRRIGRPRALEDLVYRMCDAGVIPSLCVACYTRRRRAAMGGAAGPAGVAAQVTSCTVRGPGVGAPCCAPNALLALKDYLMDYASPQTRVVGDRLIQTELARLSEEIRGLALELMEEAEAGLRGQVL